ncbi:GPW/gp25 family protein [Collimonas pratensis]|nr:GPW/gp25 family protein [Collimonas pratensis]
MSRLAHIRQSLADILTTPIGSRVMRRNYGSEVPELIDQPLNGATVLRIYAATAYAVLHWERRIALTGVQLQRGADGQATLLLDGVTNEQSVQLAVPVGSGATL